MASTATKTNVRCNADVCMRMNERKHVAMQSPNSDLPAAPKQSKQETAMQPERNARHGTPGADAARRGRGRPSQANVHDSSYTHREASVPTCRYCTRVFVGRRPRIRAYIRFRYKVYLTPGNSDSLTTASAQFMHECMCIGMCASRHPWEPRAD